MSAGREKMEVAATGEARKQEVLQKKVERMHKKDVRRTWAGVEAALEERVEQSLANLNEA